MSALSRAARLGRMLPRLDGKVRDEKDCFRVPVVAPQHPVLMEPSMHPSFRWSRSAFLLVAWALVSLLPACGTDELVGPPKDKADAITGSDAVVTLDAAPDGVGTDAAQPGADADVAPDSEPGQDTVLDTGPDELDVLPIEDTDAIIDGSDADAEGSDVAPVDSEGPDVDADSEGSDAVDAGPACATAADCPAASPCMVATCDAGVCAVAPQADGTVCDDGSPCTEGDACAGGVCVAKPLSCDDGNPCTDDACVQPTGCAHQDNTLACDDGDVCSQGDVCAAGKCTAGAVKTACDDGNVCTDDSCDAKAGCVHGANAASCQLADACQLGTVCSGGACTGGSAKPCDDGNPCTADGCDSKTGACLATDVTGACDDGDGCTLGDACGGGKCNPGSAKSCDDGNPCTSDACDVKTGGCTTAPKDGACDDGSACTLGDKCAAGLCAGGAAPNCDDGNPCTDDACDAKVGCTHGNNTVPCSVGGDVCQLATCTAGKCVATGNKGCDDGNPCTANSCDPVKGCQFPALADGTTCVGGDACVTPALCAAGVCQAGKKTDCGDANPCTDDTCDGKAGCVWLPNAATCEDGNPCTAGDACKNGKCQLGTAVDPKVACNDSNVCTDDACDPKSGCTHANNTAACEDGNVCTKGDACGGGACKGGVSTDCDDGKTCTNDLCDAKTGACSWTGKAGACDDGNACTANDACANGNCAPGSAKNCDDANPCTVDGCDAKTGACTHTATVQAGVPCDDGNACTDSDVCKGAVCSGAVKALNCDDANVCTTEGCDPKTGACTHTNNTGGCDDGNKCTSGDLCDGKGTCGAGPKPTCDDANACTTDTCDAATGNCKYTAVADGTTCDDGIACTTASGCKAGLCAPTASECSLFADAFECAAKGAGWTLTKPFGYQTLWGVDQTPQPAGGDKYLCTLNYNDGNDYCDFPFGNYCYPAPNLTAISPVVDETVKAGMPHLTFVTYYDLDPGTEDTPLVTLRDDGGTKAVLDQFLLSKSTTACGGPCQGVWRTIDIDVPKVAGKKFHVELSLSGANNTGNKGKGWFVDNVKVSLQFGAEKCGNGLDDDGNGKLDCADPVCAPTAACKP
jgi:hypothetical protein